MASYYYLISSLPMLRASGKPPLTYAEFLAACESTVSESRYAALAGLTLSLDKGPLLSEWAKFHSALRSALADYRNARLGKRAPGGDKDAAMTKAVSDAVSGKDPLAAEEALLALEFDKLDELTGTHCFDEHALTGYALKLKLLERKNVFDREKGKAELGRILDGLRDMIPIGGTE